MPKTMKVKAILSTVMLCQLISITEMFDNAVTFKALFNRFFLAFIDWAH